MAESRSGGSRSGSKSSRSTTARSAPTRKAAKKGGQAAASRQKARKTASGTAKRAAGGAGSAGVEAKTVAEFRDALRKNLIRPLEMVMLSRDRIEEALGEAVDQGRVTARDAQRITANLVKRGEKQTRDVLGDLEQLLGRGRDEIEERAAGARKAAGGAAKSARGARGRATRAASPALAQVDRVRRGASVGPSFPITGYDDLNAAQIQGRLDALSSAQLRKVRDHERRNANRKSILKAIESKLA
jgi:polyhydroxyalkanoate synthesis regulator phasin